MVDDGRGVDRMKTYIFAGCLAFVTSLISCAFIIPILRKWKAGQNILSYVKEHKGKYMLIGEITD